MPDPLAPQEESPASSSLATLPAPTSASASQSLPDRAQPRISSTLVTVENSQSDTPPESPPQNERQTIRLAQLSAQAASLTGEIASARAKLQNPDVNATISRHIKLLHDYNGIRDVGLGLMEMLAERRGVRLADILAEMGVGDGD